jgi:uncharacterized protein HemY
MLGNFSLGNTIVIMVLAVAVIAGIVILVRALLGHPRKRRKG